MTVLLLHFVSSKGERREKMAAWAQIGNNRFKSIFESIQRFARYGIGALILIGRLCNWYTLRQWIFSKNSLERISCQIHWIFNRKFVAPERISLRVPIACASKTRNQLRCGLPDRECLPKVLEAFEPRLTTEPTDPTGTPRLTKVPPPPPSDTGGGWYAQ